jgi:hypothetical protein
MSSSTSIPLPKLVTGGDFAGLSATFSPTTGALVPIPEYLVPKELLEWGQAPSSLEIIVSEDINEAGDNEDKTAWLRQTVTAFPAVGCGVDNLHTQKQEASWQTIWQEDTARVAVKAAAAGAAAVDSSKQVWTVEVSFGWNPEQLKEKDTESSTSDNNSSSSHRVSMEVTATKLQDVATLQLQTPLHVRLERQTNSDLSSGGKIADGGGLDGRQVVQLLGKALHGQSSFATKPAVARWEAAAGADNHSSSSVQLSERVHFPGNLTLAYGSSSNDGDGDDSATVLEVGHITLINDHLSIRHVIQCTLPSSSTESNSNEHAIGGLPVVRSWTEEGTIV